MAGAKLVVVALVALALATLYPLLQVVTVPYETSLLIKAPRAKVAAFLLDHTQSSRLQPLVYPSHCPLIPLFLFLFI
jgi:hypothetical protein